MLKSISQWVVMGACACSCQPDKNSTHCQSGFQMLEDHVSSQSMSEEHKIEQSVAPVTSVEPVAVDLSVVSEIVADGQNALTAQEVVTIQEAAEVMNNEVVCFDIAEVVPAQEESSIEKLIE